MARKAVWCFTIAAGKCVSTPHDGVSVEFNGKNYRFVLGTEEEPDNSTNYRHQHGFIQCSSGNTLKKGQAISILRFLKCYEEGNYVHELDSTKAKYLSYCFKSETNMFSSAERAIKRGIDSVASKGLKLTPKRLKAELVHLEGASFVAKNKQVIDVTLGTPEVLIDRSRVVEEELNSESNCKTFWESIQAFRYLVTRALFNGLETTHKAFEDSNRKEQAKSIVIIALLPMVVNRKRITDKIPGLFFWGNPHCGKSFMFSQLPCWKKVSTDAEGVSRFKLEGVQSGFLVDDVDSGWLFKSSNQKTLKALSIGEAEVVKTFGETVNVRGFVAITSNSIPDFLRDEPELPPDVAESERASHVERHKINCLAWKRRMLAVKFTEPVETDGVFIDFEDRNLDKVAAHLIVAYGTTLKHEPLKELFKPYVEHLDANLSDEDTEFCRNAIGEDFIKWFPRPEPEEPESNTVDVQ